MANNLTRFGPFRDLARFDPFRDIDEMLRDFSPALLRGGDGAPRMRMDVTENEQEYMVKADLPGVQKEDIKIAINGNQVSLTAEMKEEKDAGSGMLRSERYCGQVYRSFTLPQEVDDDKAEAKYENGVLRLTLPKRVGTGGKQLQVQ
ncbi:Hsp20/alpha crystallin family protein [Rugamonas sp.]|uniref:Hsp20/alpha crystallin family protein n=1 Tax=Rugamonas sp. TaxID=1926287 RepID=UPI0025FEB6FB|nr:Hsp20/alpha crystallin family protein [Rugamonas sp.]